MDKKTKSVLDIFEKINLIPRASGNEEKIGLWLEQWAKDHGFKTDKDGCGNIVIRIPAAGGFENAACVVLQNHVDMVCEKSPDSKHDFRRDPIIPIYDGDLLKADKTTLGADNGIGMALAMAIALDKAVERPALELLFTVEEETGLVGANRLDPKFIKGKTLINMDSENEGIFTIGCAGGKDTEILLDIDLCGVPKNFAYAKLSVKGLKGGHSGVDIHRQRGNANRILARMLRNIQDDFPIQIVSLKGGSAYNAIPRDSSAVIAFESAYTTKLKKLCADFENIIKKEFGLIEDCLVISSEEIENAGTYAMTFEIGNKAVSLILSLEHGALTFDTEGVVETSINLAFIETLENKLRIVASQRSLIMSKLEEITQRVRASAELAGAASRNSNKYPPWLPNRDSFLLEHCITAYKELFGREPEAKCIHAGLECAVIGEKYPGIDMISLGPDIDYPHSPSESVYIPSIKKVYDFLAVLFTKISG